MADSTALRVRRSRAHKAGDHSLCRRCSASRGEISPNVAALPPLPGARKLDPAAEMRNLALRLAAAHEEQPSNALLARELRMTLSELMSRDAEKTDDIFAEYGTA